MKSIEELTSQFAQSGKVVLITIRAERRSVPVRLEEVVAVEEIGLKGDHYASKSGNRQVTLIAQEHLNAAASMLGKDSIDPLQTRRNIVTSGINLHALKGKRFQVGESILEYTGECHPCSRMEENLGRGGYNAMRGHGGITCRVVQSGRIATGDKIITLP